MKWNTFAMQIPMLIGIAMQAVERIKGAKGPEKEAAVIATIKDGVVASETISGKDIINDASLDQLLAAYISSRVALQNFLTKKAQPEGVLVPNPTP